MRTIAALTLAVAASGFACGGDPVGPSGAAGTLNLMIKDSPYSDAKSLLVTFSEVTAHRDGEGGFTTLPFAGGATLRTCDLKKLVDAQDVLGVGTMPEGHYTQLRLVVSSAVLYFDSAAAGPACASAVGTPVGRSAVLEIPSGEVKLNRPFDVTPTGATTILIDFDGDKSVTETGNGKFRMTPVIGVVSVQ
ncbi:MAG TPA: DUF4382 domain-containing protein [Vicinamibacterales bacterium]|nr:DUF4382 domain-containing protein [Vicinamibacterales bacterium]